MRRRLAALAALPFLALASSSQAATDDPIDFEVSNADEDTDLENSANDEALFESDSFVCVMSGKVTFGI